MHDIIHGFVFIYVGSQGTNPVQAPKRRSRGLASLIKENEVVDITNLQPVSKRCCMEKAERYMSKQRSNPCKARGDPVAGGKIRWSKTTDTIPPNNPQSVDDKPVDTLKRILIHDKDTFVQGFELINTYTEQNISHEMLKSTVIKVFSTAINSWNMSILQAAQCAADVSGVAVYTARKWVATYYLSLIGVNMDNVTGISLMIYFLLREAELAETPIV